MDQFTVQDLTSVVGSLGFPIAVTWFLLTKGSQVVTNITIAINDMKVAVVQLTTQSQLLGERLEQLEKDRKMTTN